MHAREEGGEARVGGVGLLEDPHAVAANGHADASVQARLCQDGSEEKGE